MGAQAILGIQVSKTRNCDLKQGKKKQVRSDKDASEVDIFGHFRTFLDNLGHYGTIWDILGQLRRLYDEFGAFRSLS